MRPDVHDEATKTCYLPMFGKNYLFTKNYYVMKGLSLLPLTLRINGITSVITGLALIFFESGFQQLLGVSFPFSLVGVSLLVFAIFVLSVARRKPVVPALVWVVIALDVLWVLGSVEVMLADTSITPLGHWMIGIVALVVADFAIFQFIGLRNILQATRNMQGVG